MDDCTHEWTSEPFTAYDNKIMGTYDKGLMWTCSLCGAQRYERRYYNNYSGD